MIGQKPKCRDALPAQALSTVTTPRVGSLTPPLRKLEGWGSPPPPSHPSFQVEGKVPPQVGIFQLTPGWKTPSLLSALYPQPVYPKFHPIQQISWVQGQGRATQTLEELGWAW